MARYFFSPSDTDSMQEAGVPALEELTERELVNRVRPGQYAYLVVGLLCWWTAPWLWPLVLTQLLLTGLRLIQIRLYRPRQGSFWRGAFVVSMMATATLWGLIPAVVLLREGVSATALVLLMVLSGIGSGSTLTFAPHPRGMRAFLGLMYIPPLLVAMMQGGAELTLLLGVYLVYLNYQGDKQSRWFLETMQVSQQLARANRTLQAEEHARGQHFANVSHELRTPLTLILSPVESLLATGGLPEPATRALQGVQRNAVRMLEMVNALLDFSRLQAGELPARRESVDLDRLCRSVVEAFGAHRIELSCQLAVPCRQLDLYLVERILFNLLGNAVKFTPEDRRVGLEVREEADAVELTVWDEGPGIEQADLGRLFRRFAQLDGSANRRFGGTGLGLAMVRDFAELLGGSVRVESTPGVGSRFCVRLLAPVATSAPRPWEAPRPVAAPALVERARAETPGILVAEDNPELAHYLVDLLSAIGPAESVANGREALEWLAHNRPSLILSDVMMPEVDGLSLCRQLKADPELAEIPIILLTASTMRDTLLEGWAAGADEYLMKPFHPVELQTRVRSLLRAASERQELRERVAQARKDESLRALAGGLAHDYNNQLAAILGNLELARVHPGLEHGTRELLDEALAAVARSTELTGRLLAYLGFLHDARRATDLAETAGCVARECQRGVELQLGSSLVLCDPKAMRTVVDELVRNACEASQPEGAIRLSTGTEAEDAWLEVEDEGCGMDSHVTDRMFDPGYSSKSLGRGMGLAAVAGIVRSHGGECKVFSRPGSGTRIRVTLPRLTA